MCKKTKETVLILIILEYIYIGSYNRYQWWNFVLILIILEYIYIYKWMSEGKATSSLNPYYTGIHLHKKPMKYATKTIMS